MEGIIEILIKKMIDFGFSLSSEILRSKIIVKNNDRLLRKKEKLKKEGSSSEEISKIILDKDERFDGKLEVTKDETFDKLIKHVEDIKNWSTEIGFRDLRDKKQMDSIYIELDTFLMPARTHFDKNERKAKKQIYRAINETKMNCIILGQAGAGKTTSVKQLCNAFFLDKNDERYSERIPLLLRFRDIGSSESGNNLIQNYFQKIFPFKVQLDKTINHKDYENPKSEITQETFWGFLNGLKPLIVLDGFDEIAFHTTKISVLQEIKKISKWLDEAKLIITCRSGEFNYEIENTVNFEIAPLSNIQVKSFVYRWIKSKTEADKFLKDIRKSPFADTSIKPLSLAHLCAIYERIGKIPDRPKSVYRKVVNLLLEEWDEQRSVKRDSTFIKFEPDRKFEFLTCLAYYFTTKTNTITFNHRQLIEAYNVIAKNFNLTQTQYDDVVDEIEAHTGLFIQSGYESFEFVHKSIQEYLTAEYLVKLPISVLDKTVISVLGAELAITISLSSNPSVYFAELISTTLSRIDLPIEFYDILMNRLIQENPDFYENDYVGVSAFVLLSLISNDGNPSRREKSEDTLNGNRQETFDRLLKIIKTKNPLIDVKKFYKLSKHSDSGNLNYKKFERTNPHIGRLPKTIYLPLSVTSRIYYENH